MIKIIPFITFLFISIVANSQTADEIVTMHINARGGSEKIKNLKTMVMECVSNRQGMEFPVKLSFSHKKGFRLDMQIMGMDCFMLINENAAYNYFPIRGQSKPEALPDEMHKTMLGQLDLHGELLDYKEKKISITRKEDEKLDDIECYVLVSKNENGKEKTIYINKKTHLILKEITKKEVEGEEKEFESSYADYKNIDGYMLPMTLTSTMQGEMKVSKYSVNVDLSDELFTVK